MGLKLLVLLSILLLFEVSQAAITVNVGCLASNFNTSSFPVAVQAAIDYMTKFSTVSLDDALQLDFERNETAASFFNPGEVEFVLKCYETANPTGSSTFATNLFRDHGAVAIIGDTTSGNSIASSAVASEYERPLISQAATSAILSDKNAHPFFMRTIPSDGTQAKFITEYLFYYNIFEIATLFSEDTYGIYGSREIVTSTSTKGINVTAEVSFNTGTIPAALTKLKSSGATTFVVFISLTANIENVLLQASQAGLLQRPYTWIFSESLGNIFTTADDKVSVTVTSSILVQNNAQYLANNLVFVKLSSSVWATTKYMDAAMKSVRKTPFDGYAFDAMLAIGLAVKEIIREGQNVSDGHLLHEKLLFSNFIGASGKVRFDDNGDRIGAVYSMMNVRQNKLVKIADYSVISGIVLLQPNFTSVGGEFKTDTGQDTTSSALGNNWKANIVQPASRYLNVIQVHDPSARLFIFGGFDLNSVLGDMWVYSFKTELWSPLYSLSPIAPSARYDSASAMVGNMMYMFGGFDENRYLKDLWRLNIETNEWEEIRLLSKDPQPGPTLGARMTRYKNDIYMFGGESTLKCSNDVWHFDTEVEKFELVEPTSTNTPTPRTNACFISHNNKLIMFGGRTCQESDTLMDLWVFDVDSSSWEEITITNLITARYDFRCAILDDMLYLSGGWSDDLLVSLNDIYKLPIDDASLAAGNLEWNLVLADIPNHIPRDSAFFAVFQNQITWFGGWPGGEPPTNDMWSFNPVTKTITQINKNLFVVDGVTSACYTTIGSKIYGFGGRTGARSEQNYLFAYSIETKEWEILSIASDQPDPRVGCSLVSSGGNLYLFGGYSSTTGVYFGDLWVFITSQNAWTKITRNQLTPSIRAYHHAAVTKNESLMIVYGGRDTKRQFTDEIWVFDIDLTSWRQVRIANITSKPPPSAAIGVKIVLLENDNTMVAVGGSNLADAPGKDAYAFSFKTSTWSTFSSNLLEEYYSRVGVAKVSEDGFLAYGGNFYNEVNEKMVLITREGWMNIDMTKSLDQPPSRLLHAMHLIGNRVVVLHGTGTFQTTGAKSSSALLQDVWEYPIVPVCTSAPFTLTPGGLGTCVNCSAGTYQFKGRCVSCGLGLYNSEPGATECLPCAPGFFNDKIGAVSVKFCVPCPEGTFNPNYGAGICRDCPEGRTCPIGSINPSDGKFVTVSEPVLTQSTSLESKARMVYVFTVVAYCVAAGISVIVVLVCVLVTCRTPLLKDYMSRLDFFFTDLHQFSLGFLELKKTRFGGIFSIVAILFVIALISATIFNVAADNTQERRSLIPNLQVKNTSITADIDFKVIISGSLYSCDSAVGLVEKVDPTSNVKYLSNCHPRVEVSFARFVRNETLLGSTTEIPLPTVVCDSNGMAAVTTSDIKVCNISIHCTNCRMSGGDSLIKVILNDRSFVNGYQYGVNSSTGIVSPMQFSTVSVQVRPEQGKLFRGFNNPTTAIIRLIQTSFSHPSKGVKETGYHIDYEQTVLGDQVSIFDFNQRTGAAFAFQMKKEGTTLDVVYAEKKEVQGVITELLGSMVGIISAVGIVMKIMERIVDHILPNAIKKGFQLREVIRRKNDEKGEAALKPMEMKPIETPQSAQTPAPLEPPPPPTVLPPETATAL